MCTGLASCISPVRLEGFIVFTPWAAEVVKDIFGVLEG